uniref:Crystaline entomocidal protoxin n=1 Tax=Bacillus thuringiensis TaxID=1428 RepID=V9HXG6_BACTU|nr:Cry8-like protein [Bacillus thuringiensis]AEB52298.1 Cry0302 [Bacillus thuringiensis]
MTLNNQNEYEIIDTPSRTSVSNESFRYPLASNQSTSLQNRNYKDWLNTLEGGNNQGFINIEGRLSLEQVLAVSAGVASYILSNLGPFGVFFSYIIGAFWPTAPSDTRVWEAFMELIEARIDQKIQESTRKDAIARLQGLGAASEVYQESLESWLENQNDARAMSVVRQQFVAFELDFVTAMPFFERSGDEILLLAVYAQAANLHLLLLRDASLYGADWGMEPYDIANYYNRQKERTATYSNHCMEWYKKGLDELWSAGGYGGDVWQDYNDFRREMTLSVLDFVALFPNYDTHLYPIEVKGELTREIYTPGINIDIDRGRLGKVTLENALVNSPRLFSWLKEIQLFTNINFNPRWKFLSATRIGYKLTGYRSVNFEPYEGFYFEGLFQSNFTLNDYQEIYIVDVTRFGSLYDTPTAITAMTFFKDDNTTFNYSSNTPSGEPMITSGFYLPGIDGSEEPTSNNFSHRLSTINTYNTTNQTFYHTFGWTHVSVDRNNTIVSNKITQIPFVKANTGNVVRGPGHTGGDLVVFKPAARPDIVLRVGNTRLQSYRVRVRYASNADISLELDTTYEKTNIHLQKTFNSSEAEDLTYDNFQYAEADNIVWLGQDLSQYIEFQNAITNDSTAIAYFERVEFLPVGATYEAEQDLETAKKVVNALFTNTKNALQMSVTDYEVTQAANLVECVSDELFPNEKRLLFDAVKEAKRLSGIRNLLQDSDFQEINGENGWVGSIEIEIREGDTLFKGYSLRLPSAREIYMEMFPTYLHQKIEESRLKPYTRYRLRGFVSSSQDLEIFSIRHETNRIVKNVSDDLLPNLSSYYTCGGVNRCSTQKYVYNRLEFQNSLSSGNRYSDAHSFSIPIDTGKIDLNDNTGIWIAFKLATTGGYATLGNLELVEEAPLIGDTLERVQREDQQWKSQMTRKREEAERKYMAAKQAIDRLYADYQDHQLNPNVEITDITATQHLVQSLPYVNNDVLQEIPGMNYTRFTELTNRLQQAWELYGLRNMIANGDFRNGLNDWDATSGVNIQQINHTSVLVISNWDAQISKQFTVQPNQKYVLRVTVRKEGSGDGYVTIRDGGNHTETLTFNTCDYERSNVYNEKVFQSNDYGTNNVYHTQTTNANRYTTNSLYNDGTGYVTKTVEFIPYTEQVWIEMSETEGVFYVESIEFILEEV